VAKGIQDAAEKGHQAHEQDIGEGDPGQQHREVILHPGTAEPEGLDPHNPGGEQNAQDGHRHQHQGEKGHHRSGKLKGILPALPAEVLGEHGNEGDGEGAFRKKPSQEVGDSKRHEEGICRHPGAKIPGHHHVPDEAQDPAQEGVKPYHAGSPADISPFGRGPL